jgi:hypothetical protein
MEIEQQDAQQPELQPKKRVVGRPFVGSGNPSGMTASRRHSRELLELFRVARGREPTAAEAMQIRAAGRLAAKLDPAQPRAVSNEDVARMTCRLNQTLRLLKLDKAPADALEPRPSALDRLKRGK